MSGSHGYDMPFQIRKAAPNALDFYATNQSYTTRILLSLCE
uniref:Uncharacterized protein n=1 Tax=Picea glauca TaxID=3330 RepID=A0A117NHD2_PICGL|nr:hypothetical protein ABT39_MTgene5183 [Picea glauca]